MTDTIKYLDYAGLVKFKEELDSLRLADKLEITSSLNTLSGDIGNGTLTLKRNNVTLGTFSANQKTNDSINISVPTSIADLGQTAITEIQNLINYGQLDVSSLTEEQKEALHDATTASSDFVTDTDLTTELADYGKIINYDSSTQMIQLKNGDTVLSQFSAQDFLIDGMLEDVRITNGTGDNTGESVLLIDFNTDSGITDIEIPLKDIFDASNYYTKSEIDNAGYLTSHQDISGKADKSEMSVVAGTGNNSDKTTITLKSGTSATVLTSHQDISGKANSADLATVATSGSYADLSNKPTIYSAQEIQNIIQYGVADISGYTSQELENLEKYGVADISELTEQEIAELEEEKGQYAKASDIYDKTTSDSRYIRGVKSGSTLLNPDVNGVVTVPEAEANIQSDWNESDNTSDAYILNKPTEITQQTILNLFGGSSVDPTNNVAVITTSNLDTQVSNLGYSKFSGSYTDLTNAPASLPASDVQAWAKAANKPSYNYTEINYLSNTASDYTISSVGGAVTVDGTKPLQVITISAAISGITFTALPENGHSCHLIITAASDLSVAIAHDATMITVDDTAYKSVCPAADDVSLDIAAGGYVELDLLRVGTNIYVRGI